jgi:NADP-dependent 3-hydroxy acid dehydrogenase YdfG
MGNRKVCIVTGSSSGIGAATVRRYAGHGWDVVVNYSRDAAPAEAVADECRGLGVDALVVKADVSSDADCRRLASEVDARFGRADVLVNNAGTTKFVALKDLDGLDAEDFQRIYAVNVIGPYQMSRALVSLLKRNPVTGIVNVSSIAGLMGTGSSIAYMASKGALNAMTSGTGACARPRYPRQRDRAGTGRNAVAAERAWRRTLCADGAGLQGALGTRCGDVAGGCRRRGMVAGRRRGQDDRRSALARRRAAAYPWLRYGR